MQIKTYQTLDFLVSARTPFSAFRESFDDIGISEESFKKLCLAPNDRSYNLRACLFDAEMVSFDHENLEDVIVRIGRGYDFLRFLTSFELLSLQLQHSTLQTKKPIVTHEFGLGASSYATFGTCSSELLGKTIAPLRNFSRDRYCPPALIATTFRIQPLMIESRNVQLASQSSSRTHH